MADGRKIELISARNPRWANPERTEINIDARWSHLKGTALDREHPFLASPRDCEAHGRDLFRRAAAGEFGEIDDYMVSPVSIGEMWAKWDAAGEKPLPEGTIGWRMWLGDKDGLHTLGTQELWKPGRTITATDDLSDVARDDTPDGIYSFKTMMRALSLAEKMQARFPGRYVGVVGSVTLSGHVLEHEHGFRSTRADLRSIDLALSGDPALLDHLRETYGVGASPDFLDERASDPVASKLVFVLGPYRSGTSLIARTLQHTMEVDFGERRTLPGDPKHQPNGYFEDLDLLALDIGMTQSLGGHWFDKDHVADPDLAFRLDNEGFTDRAAAFLAQKRQGRSVLGLKDFRAAPLLPLWRQAIRRSGVDASYVITLRHPANCVASAQRFDWTGLKVQLARQWTRHMLAALEWTAGEPCAVIDYDKLVDHQWNGPAIASALGLPAPSAPIEAIATTASRHFSFKSWGGFSQTAQPKLALEIYDALKGGVGVSDEATERLPEWDRRYEAGEP